MLLMDHRCPDLAPTNEQLSTIYGYFPVGSGGYCAVEKNLTLGGLEYTDPASAVNPDMQYSDSVLALNIDWTMAANLLAALEQHVPNFSGGDRHATLMNQAIVAAGQAGRLSPECTPTTMAFIPRVTVATPPERTKTIALPPKYVTTSKYSTAPEGMSGLGEMNPCLQQLLGLVGSMPYPLADDLKQLVITNFGLKPKPFFKKPVFIVGAGVVVVGVAAFLFLRD